MPGHEATPELLAAVRAELGDRLLTVDAALRKGGEEGTTPAQLSRWLVARKSDPRTAAADLAAHASWRADWAPEGRVHEEDVAADLAQDKVFLLGTDARGRGVLLLQARKHTLTESEAQQRFITYCLDALIATCAPDSSGKAVAIFDLQGLGLRNLDGVGLKNVFRLLAAHYVERLSKLYMLNAPSIFWTLWKVVSPFIDPVTRAKVAFLAGSDVSGLAAEVGRECLPPQLGGTAEPVPVQIAVARLVEAQRLPVPPPAPAAAAAATCLPCTGGRARVDAEPADPDSDGGGAATAAAQAAAAEMQRWQLADAAPPRPAVLAAAD